MYLEREREREREGKRESILKLKPFTIQYVFLDCNNNSLISMKVKRRYTK